MPTRQELEQALINADAAGDTQAATALADALASGQYDQQAANPKASPPDAAGDGSTLGGIADFGLELAAAVNRGAVNLADFLTVDQVNALSSVMGSDFRLPSVGSKLESGTVGGFMEPGLARDVTRAAGEVVPGAVATSAALTKAASGLPQFAKQSEGVGAGILRQFGAEPAANVAKTAAISGAGSEAGRQAGGEAGEIIGGDEGRTTGEMLGSLAGGIMAPIAAQASAEAGRSLVTKSAKQLLKDAAPTIDGLKSAARGVYKEIDDLGATVNPGGVTRLAATLRESVRKEGFNKRIHPKVSAALDEFDSIKGTPQSLSEIDTLRKVARAAANSIDPDEARLGVKIVDKIDDFLDDLPASQLIGAKGPEVSAKYRDARQLWSRAKKAELIDDAFAKAKNQATGFENGLRVQFRSILNNKKKLKGFSKDEIEAMELVVRGGTAENIAKMLGRFGMSEGQASNMLMGSLGIAGGAAVGGAPGAVAVPLVGQVSRRLAQKMTANNAELANAVVRAGTDGRKVINAYMRATKPADRSVQELTELLMRPSILLPKLEMSGSGQNQKLIADSIYYANSIRQAQESNEE